VFSDRHRWLKIALSLLALGGLGAHYAQRAATRPVGWRICLSAPATHHGRTLVLPLYTVTAVRGPGDFEISKSVRDIPVLGGAQDLSVGDTVSVRGAFDAGGPHVAADAVEVHRLRWAKKALSAIGLILALIAASWAFSWRNGRLVERLG